MVKRVNAVVALCVIGLLALSTGCTKPPTQEIADAEAALSAAKLEGADVFVPTEYRSAEEMLAKARTEMEKKENALARDAALQAKSMAEMAKLAAITVKSQRRSEAGRMIQELKTTLSEAEGTGAKRFYPADYDRLSRTLKEVEQDFSAERYDDVISKTQAALVKANNLVCSARLAKLEEERRKAEEELREARRKADEEARRRQEAEEARRRAEEELRRCREMKVSQVDSHTVKRGECLWVISDKKSVYDNPFQWPLIYKANRSQIRDPDLIFPRQKFKVPQDFSNGEKQDAVQLAKTRGPWSLYDGK